MAFDSVASDSQEPSQVSQSLRLQDTLVVAPILLVILAISGVLLEGEFYFEHSFPYEATAVALAAPLAYVCSRVGFFDALASILVGLLLGCYFSVAWGLNSGELLYSAQSAQVVVFPSTLYGGACSMIFRTFLELQRPEAFADPPRPIEQRISSAWLVFLSCLPFFAAGHWFRILSLIAGSW